MVYKFKNKKNKEYTFNLKLGFNKKLSLVQLYKYPSPEKMFNNNYAFFIYFKQYEKTFFKIFKYFKKKDK